MIVDDLKEKEKRTEERLDKLEKVMEEVVQWSKENAKAIQELTKGLNFLTKTVDKGFKEIWREIGGIANTFGMMFEETVREGIIRWFKENNIQVTNVSPKTVRVGKKLLEFDIYAEAEDRVYVDEVKVRLRERDVEKFSNKVAF
ncbi:hypothetical protein [Acidianus sp. RZ1]|uniref:hypothetical protein n=1 Tax=Acidianus sp. RZ1 TaxID=1540082 RepID=UPI001492C5B2|nr:hypothetical protein [Acidianus sp. RZ1]NON62958.1 hypothetical protein [Acidianus sp. RZ1]